MVYVSERKAGIDGLRLVAMVTEVEQTRGPLAAFARERDQCRPKEYVLGMMPQGVVISLQ